MKVRTAKEIIKDLLNGVVFDDVQLVGNDMPLVKRTLMAFYNTRGGTIIIGLREKDRKFVKNLDFDFVEKQVNSYIKSFSSYVPVSFLRVNYFENQVLFVKVPRLPLDKIPTHLDCFTDSYSLFRDGDSNRPMPMWYLKSIEVQKGICFDEKVRVHDFKEKFDDPNLFQVVINEFNENHPSFSSKKNLQILNSYLTTGTGRRNLAYVLTFCIFPQLYFPHLVVELYDSSSDNDPVETIDGSLSSMLKKTVLKIKKMIGFRMRLINGRLVQEESFPMSVISELVFNALVHRDYSSYFRGLPIKIRITKDTFEITNPGQVFETAELLVDPHVLERNPTIKLMNKILLKNQNIQYGFDNVISNCKVKGFDPPIITSSDGWFTIKLRQAKISSIYHGKITIENLYNFCLEPKSKLEIYKEFSSGNSKHNDYLYFIEKYISPLLKEGLLVLTIPEKPKSKFQKIVVSDYYRS